jgi:hypothetical protein
VDARLANSSAVPPFKPRKVSCLLSFLCLFLFWALEGGLFAGWNVPHQSNSNHVMELVRRRSLASPRSASICFTPFRAFPLLTSRDEVGIFRINTMFLLMSRWPQYLDLALITLHSGCY